MESVDELAFDFHVLKGVVDGVRFDAVEGFAEVDESEVETKLVLIGLGDELRDDEDCVRRAPSSPESELLVAEMRLQGRGEAEEVPFSKSFVIAMHTDSPGTARVLCTVLPANFG